MHLISRFWRIEPVLLTGAAALGGLGIALVNLGQGGGVDQQTGFGFLGLLLAFGMIWMARNRYAPRASLLVFTPISVILAVSVTATHSISVGSGQNQIWLILLGAATVVGLLWMLSSEGTQLLSRWHGWNPLVVLLLLSLTLIPSTSPSPIRGQTGSFTHSIVDLGIWEYVFSPIELAWGLVVIYLATVWSRSDRGQLIWKWGTSATSRIIIYTLLWLGIAIVIFSRQNLGWLAITGAILIGMYYYSSSRTRVMGMGVGGLAALLLISWLVFDRVGQTVSIWLYPYDQPEGIGFDLSQGIYAFGSGSLAGSGLGWGQPDLIPSATSDYLLAVVGEEMGYAGTVLVLVCFGIFIATGFGIALAARQRRRTLLAGGLVLWLGLQILVSLGASLRMFPPSQLSTPFFSAGGLGIPISMGALALLLRISHEETS